jgi:NADP-reducing hydrogenase subunit HndD
VDLRTKRAAALYADDAAKTLRASHRNPTVKLVYSEYFKDPGSHKAHDILHTTYKMRPHKY